MPKTMQLTHSRRSVRNLLTLAMAMMPLFGIANPVPEIIDDFSDENLNQLGFPRMVIEDTAVGGKSTYIQTVASGAISMKGDLVPPRGQPGWVSLVFPLSPDGSPVDLSAYEGVRLRIRVQQGMLSLSVNSTEVVNYDYHAALLEAGGAKYSELKIPFKSLKRAWSEATSLNTQTIASISLTAVGIQPGAFAYELAEIGFY